MAAFLKMARLDFLSTKHTLSILFPLLIIAYASFRMPLLLLCLLTTWIAPISIPIPFGQEEINHLDRLYGSVGLSLKDIVLGRYTYILFKYFTSLLIVFAVHILVLLHDSATMLTAINAMFSFASSFLLFSVLAGIQVPLLFYLGYKKLKFWSLIPFMVPLILLPFSAVQSAVLKNLAQLLMFIKRPSAGLIAGIILAGCVILFLSYKASCFLYRKRRQEG